MSKNLSIAKQTAQWLRANGKPVPSSVTDPEGWEAAKAAFLAQATPKAAKKVARATAPKAAEPKSRQAQAFDIAFAQAPEGLRQKAGRKAFGIALKNERILPKTAAKRALEQVLSD
jgi:hypothetical protein